VFRPGTGRAVCDDPPYIGFHGFRAPGSLSTGAASGWVTPTRAAISSALILVSVMMASEARTRVVPQNPRTWKCGIEGK
jgi:hypothetical protein